ncbi:zinc ribbon domain-containing protein [Burkholderia sp. Ax-1719]|uniref:zinc ribbon domain-containing protein n=1 Tax=Burkholderia sp. Ax-1719 TaxID=2608334 RepID=UPI001420C6EF|nr:zinc ribbon domain-containing protein [Burkholderia sp. Ax-1719]NIE64363.1 zinc-ribbon domain-containing protein [Burkholderia sp. Ax-1719]
MARFCVKCGSKLDPDARFCDECGAPVQARRAANVASAAHATTAASGTPRPGSAGAAVAPAAVPLDINWRKVGLWSGVGVAVLLVAGGVAAFLAMPPSTPSASDLTDLLNADKTKVASATCLSNFPYGKNPVVVGGFDANTLQWLQVLSRAGIYGPPQPVTNAFMFGGGQQFSHTALGEKKIRDGKLCFADGLTVTSVEFTKPVKIGERWHTQGSYGYTYRNADAWTQTPEAQRAEPNSFANLPKTTYVSLVKGDHGWQIDNGTSANDELALLNSLQGGMQGRARSESHSHGGLFSKIATAVSGLFGSQPPYVGKWREGNTVSSVIEFTRDSATFEGNTTTVEYVADKQDSKQFYLKHDGANFALVKVIDHDTLEFSLGFGSERLHRVD